MQIGADTRRAKVRCMFRVESAPERCVLMKHFASRLLPEHFNIAFNAW